MRDLNPRRKKAAGGAPWYIIFLIAASLSAPEKSPPRMPPEQVVEVRGQKLHYFEAGRGKAVILLHGLGADSRHWVWNFGLLARHA